MPLTGQELFGMFRNQVSQTYTTYTGGTVRANRLFLSAILQILKKGFDSVELQDARASINFLIKTDKEYSLNNNQIYEKKIEILGLANFSGNALFITNFPHNFITGDQVTIAGISGFANNPNGTFTVNVSSPIAFGFSFALGAGAYTGGGTAFAVGKQLTDYWEMIDVNAKYNVPYAATFTSTNSTPIRITLNRRTDLTTGQRVFIAGCSNTQANGERWVQKLNDFTFALYSSPILEAANATVGSATSTNGTISKTYYNTCKPFLPKTEIDPLSDATLYYPKYKESERMLKFFPQDRTCEKILISYYAEPEVVIDTADSTRDLSLYYPQEFLTGGLINAAGILFGQEARDSLLVANSNQNIQQAS